MDFTEERILRTDERLTECLCCALAHGIAKKSTFKQIAILLFGFAHHVHHYQRDQVKSA